MDAADARALIAPGVSPGPAHWADLGAGEGTFTAALAALLGAGATIEAVDRDPRAVRALERLARATPRVNVRPRVADVDDPALALPRLDGVLMANALHFVPAARQPALLERLAATLAPDGRLLVVEYEGRAPSRWVPAPVSFDRLCAIAPDSLAAPVRIGLRPSAYGGAMYAARLDRRQAPR